MDPSTTLITFMLQTASSTQSVTLLGSWDNFTRHYQMEKDLRRGRDQWRGCWSFKDIICDGDGDGASSPKRNGGLKMGHTYWYYYELDDGTEIHDASLPSTTACPYLPGQPVNLLWVPVEVSPLRDRSASMGAVTSGYKTMNPDDKFLAPRAPPTVPRLSRLNTSPSLLERKRTARSVSPGGGKSPWSARKMFGLKSPVSAAPAEQSRQRTPWDFGLEEVKPRTRERKDSNFSRITLPSSSSHSTTKSQVRSRDTSPLRHPVVPLHSMVSTANPLTIPFDITEEDLANLSEDDDDHNFATSSPSIGTESEVVGALTSLSPPPTSQRRSPLSKLRTAISDMKPLPMLPADPLATYSPATMHSPSLVPEPLRIISDDVLNIPASVRARLQSQNIPRSHFSIDSITSTSGFASPSESHLSSPPDFYDSNDDEDISTDDSFSFNFNFDSAPSQNTEDRSDNAWRGYSLPVEDASSQMTLHMKKLSVGDGDVEAMDEASADVTSPRATFGPGMALGGTISGAAMDEGQGMSAMDQLLAEMGYLGGIIIGK